MNKATMKLAVLAAGTIFATCAQATTVTYNFTTGGTNTGSGFGNERTFSSATSSITVEATAFSLSSLNGAFAAAQLGRASGIGLYVCNTSEGLGCSSPTHQIDNVSGYDFVLFQFSQAVDPASINIATYNNADLDVTYYLGNTAANLSLTGLNLSQLASLGFGAAQVSDVDTTATSRVVGLNNSIGVNSLLVAARINGDSRADYFKISGMSVDTVNSVPEPSTVALTGAALVALGLIGRKRMAK